MASFGTRYDQKLQKSFTFVNVYDLEDRADPKLINNFQFEGYYVRGRKAEGIVYLISQFSASFRKQELPVFTINGR